VLASSIDTYVGGGIGDGGPAVDAAIDPRGISLGSPTANELYVADGRNHRIRRIDAAGRIDTVAGTGDMGFAGDGGGALNAKFDFPLDVARDSAGNLYVADSGNNRIRKITPNGQISTFAGNGTGGFSGDNGPATQAALNTPYGVAVGPDGYVYIADYANNRVRKVGPAGCSSSNCTISTVAGSGGFGFSGDNGPALNATFKNISDVAFDPAGNMLIADFNGQRIRRVVNGIINTYAGGGFTGIPGQIGEGGPAIYGVMRYPTQIAVASDGSLYIAESGQYRVRLVQAGTGVITTIAGNGNEGVSGDGGAAVAAALHTPCGIAVSSPGIFYVSAPSNDATRSLSNRIRKVTNGIIQPYAGGGLGDGGAAFDAIVDPRGSDATAATSGLPDLYFADGDNNVVRKVDGETGSMHVIAGTGARGYTGDGGDALNATLGAPMDVAVDAAGNVYIADTSNNVVRKVTANGVISTVAGTGSRGNGGDGGPATRAQLASPNGVAVDNSGRLFIADSENYRVRMVANGIISTVVGTGQFGSSGDGGPATSATLRMPFDVAVSASGILYVADNLDHRIRRVGSNGIISGYAGISGLAGHTGDGGSAVDARLGYPTNLSVDDRGRLFIVNTSTFRVRMIDASGVITTVAGNGERAFDGDGGSASAASFSSVSGVAVDPSGQLLFISSDYDQRVRLVDLDPGAAQPSVTPTRTPTSIPATPTRTPTTATTPGSQSATVSGSVSYYMGTRSDVPAVALTFSGPGQASSETNSRGDYSASLQTGSWTIQPSRLGGMDSAVSSLDAARVLQVIAGTASFTAQQRQACDTTGDGTLSSLDAVNILRLSAGVISRLPVGSLCQSDWLFTPAPALVPNQQLIQPSVSGGVCQQGAIRLDPLSVNVSNQNFTAMLFGDCTGNWSSSGAALLRTAGSAAKVHAGTPRANRNGTVRVPIYVQSAGDFQAVDIRLDFDPRVADLITARPSGVAEDALVSKHVEDGRASLSLASGAPLEASRGAILVLEFRVDEGADPGLALAGAMVDERAAAVVTHAAAD
jgi:sugar lactone lactonase YvrE